MTSRTRAVAEKGEWRYFSRVFFILSKVLWFLAVPARLVLGLFCLGAALLWTRWERAGRVAISFAAGAVVLFALFPVGPILTVVLENRFPASPVLPEHIDGIVVLGGAIRPSISKARHRPSLGPAIERLTESAAIARRHPETRIVYSGGSGSLTRQEDKEAPIAKQVFLDLGVPAERLILEDQSRNTGENARYTYDMIHPAPGETWLLVTSAAHMPRAYGCFRKVGWRIIPYPVDFSTENAILPGFGFDIAGIVGLGSDLHEWVGMLVYYMTGRIDTLFPGPSD